ncbi:ABC transporter ATP-binding protein [Exilibacterium tricleocarpae]|uniref:ABC transporter ATP-binding protein n=1 Tax=Exilibacterium tricleocarpae TaxID=2591008 RepID=UPI001C554BD1|nr:ABC transporter ATP-binding protein [Exilibacterium tricleocarpae]
MATAVEAGGDPQSPIIQVTDLVTHYGERQILKSVNFSVNRGEIMVVMGGSGSGKSTLLRHLLALEKPTSGRIMVDGLDVAGASGKQLAELRKRIGVAFQGGALLSSMTVGDNVKLPLRQHTKLNDDTIDIMARLKLEMMNLAGCEDFMPAELSGGMLKRTGLARAVIMDPKLLFFDEPSAGLDPVTSVELDDLILKLREAVNITVIVVTHELESAFKIADRITVLFDGEIVQTGTPDEIRASTDERIQNMINRRPRKDPVDANKYLNRLTAGAD